MATFMGWRVELVWAAHDAKPMAGKLRGCFGLLLLISSRCKQILRPAAQAGQKGHAITGLFVTALSPGR